MTWAAGQVSKLKVVHVARAALPWRKAAPAVSECGLELPGLVHPEELHRQIKDLGVRRVAMGTCMTCLEAARRHAYTWDDDPRRVLRRYLDRELPANYGRQKGTQLRQELAALAALAEAHPAEFTALLDRQAWLARKAATGK